MSKKFRENGYLYIKKLIRKDRIVKINRTLLDLLNFKLRPQKQIKNYNERDISKTIRDLKLNNPEKINYLYNTLKHTSAFISLFENEEILKKASKLLNSKPENLIIAEYQFRIDYPYDTKHTLNWHQDAAYYPQDNVGNDSLVCNISLHNITENMGTPFIIPKSHLGKVYDYKLTKGTKSKSGQRTINANLNEKNARVIESSTGDVTFYHPRLVHRSGYNSSNKIRLSAIARIFNPVTKNFKPFDKLSNFI